MDPDYILTPAVGWQWDYNACIRTHERVRGIEHRAKSGFSSSLVMYM